MDESSRHIEDDIADWLQAGGYPLELFTYKMLREKQFDCEKSPFFKDLESGKSREIDIVAEKVIGGTDEYDMSLRLLVECKKSEKPVLILSESSDLQPISNEIHSTMMVPDKFSNAQAICMLSMYRRQKESSPLSETVYPGYSIVQAFTKTDEQFHKKLYGLAKAESFYEKDHEQLFAALSGKKGEPTPLEVLIPVLVIDGPLFYVYLDNHDVRVEKTTWGSVTLNLPWHMQLGYNSQCNIQVVAKERFSECVEGFVSHVDWLHDPYYIVAYINKRVKLVVGETNE